MRKLFIVLILLFALFVFLNASGGIAADVNPGTDQPKRAQVSG